MDKRQAMGFHHGTVNGSVDLITRGLGESWTKTGQDRDNAPAGDIATTSQAGASGDRRQTCTTQTGIILNTRH